MNKKLNSLKL